MIDASSTSLTMYLLLVALFVVVLRLVDGRHNVTIDDPDPSIVYAPPGAWNRSATNALDYGGSHMLTQIPNATASFNFTGVLNLFFDFIVFAELLSALRCSYILFITALALSSQHRSFTRLRTHIPH